ncbi:MAG TPA: Ig-like domain-containing protein [Noviherbaspirillum sp.]|nr:Ig-like domain-containing protein [Noviherbaspirillum sp.]
MRKLYASDNVTVIGYTTYDSYVTTNYDTNLQITSITLNLSADWDDGSGASTGYSYTDAYGDKYTYSVDSSGTVTGYSATYANSAYAYSYDAHGGLLSYSYSDGVTTTVYNTDGTVQSVTASTAAFADMVVVKDDNNVVVGYSKTDDWGAVTTYYVDGQNHITHYTTAYTYEDSWTGTTYTSTYDYNADGSFAGYAYSDGKTTWNYDGNWNYVGATADTSGMTALGDGSGYSSTDQWGTTTYYDNAGHVTSYEYKYTSTWDGNTYSSHYDANWNFLSSETTDATGHMLYSSEYFYNTDGSFAGYQYFDGTTTWTYDANWNLTGTQVDTSALTPLSDGSGYSSTDAWGTTTYYDNAGHVSGYGYKYTSSWDGNTYSSHYDANWNFLSSETTDATGHVLYSSEYSYNADGSFAGYQYFDGTTTWTYDANWNLTGTQVDTSALTPLGDSSGYSSTDAWGTTTYYDNAGHVTGYGYKYTSDWDHSTTLSRYDANWNFVSSETTDANGHVLYSTEYSYVYDSNGYATFSGYEYFDGTTTWTYDANWNLISSVVSTAGMDQVLDSSGKLIGYSDTDQWGTTNYYDLEGNKTSYSYSYTNWDGSVSVSKYDANGTYLSSETRDSSGHVLYSSTYQYDANDQFIGYVYFDGTTTWTYDANWNLVSSVVSTAGMDQVLDSSGAIIGYSDTDQWGTTNYYDLSGHKTGYSYSYENTWDHSTTVSRYDASGNYLSSETKDADGHVLYSTHYSYVYDSNGYATFDGYQYFDGITTWIYDKNWQLTSSFVDTSHMDPILDSNNAVIGYSHTDQWGTTNYYDVDGNKTGYSYSWTSTWDGNTHVSKYNTAGTYIGSETKDADGHVTYSETYNFDSQGLYIGKTVFNGLSTVEYDASGNVIGGTSDPTDTTPPTVTSVSFTEGDNSTITFQFSEPVTQGQYSSGLSLHKNPDYGNGSWGEYLEVTSVTGYGTNTITVSTNATLSSTDVVQVQFWGGLQDGAGNQVAAAESWVGGSGASNINLENYSTYNGQGVMIRGQGGSDKLVGTDAADVVIDGTGADVIRGGGGADTIRLVENGSDRPYSRDIVEIRPGDSVTANGNRDVITGSSTSPENTGFDIHSSDATKHDVLSLPSANIASNVSHVDGIDVGSFAGHSITSGIVTFHDVNGADVAINMDNRFDAVRYLAQNIHDVGVTVAFKMDTDGNGSVDSLVVFQDAGVQASAGNMDLPDTLVTLHMLNGIDHAVLGHQAGADVVQLVDTQGPEVIGDVGDTMTSTGQFTLDFTENVSVTSELAVSLWKNGTEVLDHTIHGNGTQSLTISPTTALTADDWLLGSYTPTSAATGFADAAGNYMSDGGYFAVGMGGNNTIDLSALTLTSADGRGVSISGAAGDDKLVGSIYGDWFSGGTGADTMTGGQGEDQFEFKQGESTALTWTDANGNGWADTGDTLSFAGGKGDVITDFSVGDGLYLDMPRNMSGYPTMPGDMTTPSSTLIADASYIRVQGTYNAGTFTVDSTNGTDTLVVYDGDASSSVALTGVVLSGVTLSEFNYGSGNYMSLYTPSTTYTP